MVVTTCGFKCELDPDLCVRPLMVFLTPPRRRFTESSDDLRKTPRASRYLGTVYFMLILYFSGEDFTPVMPTGPAAHRTPATETTDDPATIGQSARNSDGRGRAHACDGGGRAWRCRP